MLLWAIPLDTKKRKVTHRLEKHRDGAKTLAKRAVILACKKPLPVGYRQRHFHFLLFLLCAFFRDPFSQCFQTVECLVQSIIFLGKVEPDQMIDRLPEKAGARYSAYADLGSQILTELQIAVITERRDVQHHIIRALRDVVDKTQIVQAFAEQISLMRIFLQQIIVIVLPEFQAGYNGLL